MSQGVIRSAVVTVPLVVFAAAALLETAGLASAGVTSGAVVVPITSPSPLDLDASAGNTCQVLTLLGTTVTNWLTSATARTRSARTPSTSERHDHRRKRDRRVFPPDNKEMRTGRTQVSSQQAEVCTAWTGIAGKPCNTI